MSDTTSMGPTPDSGNDSFLDILANLVGILVILVVVVAIRVKQTVPEELVPDVVDVEPIVVEPEVIVLGPEDLPINVSFAAPVAEVEAEPTPSRTLMAEIDALRRQLAAMPSPVALVDDGLLATLDAEAAALERDAAVDQAFVEQARGELAARRREYDRVNEDIGRTVAELERDDEPAVKVVSLEHDVRAIASVAGPEQIYVELSGGMVTVLPIQELLPKLMTSIRRRVRSARLDAVYSGRVGPIDGVSLQYKLDRNGASPMDDLKYADNEPIGRQIRFMVDISGDAPGQTIEDALGESSRLRYALARSLPGTSVTAFVYPDSFDIARELQRYLQTRGTKLALQPIPEGVPITHAPGGARAMAQ